MPEDLSILILPIQAVGKSNEHLRSPGTLTLCRDGAAPVVEIGESVARAGLRKLAIVNSHGGNSSLLGVVTRELRVKHQMLAVHTAWSRFASRTASSRKRRRLRHPWRRTSRPR